MNKKAFTLIELLVVVAIIGILAGYVSQHLRGIRRIVGGCGSNQVSEYYALFEPQRSISHQSWNSDPSGLLDEVW